MFRLLNNCPFINMFPNSVGCRQPGSKLRNRPTPEGDRLVSPYTPPPATAPPPVPLSSNPKHHHEGLADRYCRGWLYWPEGLHYITAQMYDCLSVCLSVTLPACLPAGRPVDTPSATFLPFQHFPLQSPLPSRIPRLPHPIPQFHPVPFRVFTPRPLYANPSGIYPNACSISPLRAPSAFTPPPIHPLREPTYSSSWHARGPRGQ